MRQTGLPICRHLHQQRSMDPFQCYQLEKLQWFKARQTVDACKALACLKPLIPKPSTRQLICQATMKVISHWNLPIDWIASIFWIWPMYRARQHGPVVSPWALGFLYPAAIASFIWIAWDSAFLNWLAQRAIKRRLRWPCHHSSTTWPWSNPAAQHQIQNCGDFSSLLCSFWWA